MSEEAPPTPTPEQTASTTPTNDAARVPVERLTAAVRERNAAQETAATATARIAELEAQLADINGKHSAVASDLVLADAGLVDPDARVVARALHNAMGEDAPALSEWVSGFADPESVPVALRGYLSPASAAAAAATSLASTQQAGAGLPAAKPASQPTPPPTSPTAALDAARKSMEAAMRSGDSDGMAAARREVERHLAGLAGGKRLR